jgi:hypothetical protein
MRRLAGLGVIFLIGCSSVPSIPVAPAQAVLGTQGIVLLSVSRSQTDKTWAYAETGFNAEFTFVEEYSAAQMVFATDTPSKPAWVIETFDNPQEHFGAVIAVQVPAGTYRLKSWRAQAKEGSGGSEVSSSTQPLPLVRVRVKSGSVTYAGSFHLQLHQEANFLGFPVLKRAEFMCQDSADRDWVAFTLERPALQNLPRIEQPCRLKISP